MTEAAKITIRFGKHSFRVAFSKWDETRHVGLIQVYGDDGSAFIVESTGLAPHEIRQAVSAAALQRVAGMPS